MDKEFYALSHDRARAHLCSPRNSVKHRTLRSEKAGGHSQVRKANEGCDSGTLVPLNCEPSGFVGNLQLVDAPAVKMVF